MTERTRRTALVAALVFLVAMCLRPALTSFGPVLPLVGADLGLGESALGLVGALPLLAFAAVSPLVHRVSTRLGEERTILAALLVLTAAIVLRSYGAEPGLWTGTFAIGIAIGVGNVLVPVLVKRDYAAHVSRATGLYTAFLAFAAGVASAASAPLAAAVDWRFALLAPGVLSLVAAIAWMWRVRRPAPAVPAAPGAMPHAGGSVWTWPTAWLVTAFMGLQSTAFYVLVTWLPTIETARGTSSSAAGVHLSVMVWVGILGSLAVPRFLRPGRDHRAGMAVAAVPMIVAAAGLLAAPGLALVWAAVAGFGQGASLTAALTMVSTKARSHAEAARLSGMAQTVGYLLAAAGPVAAGALAEVTGEWAWTLVLLVVLGVAQLASGLLAARRIA
ncbi:MFS transporter [Microbacterium gilvum]|uniref:MFS transporter n=1 Tax=Microbacterium gilvum TaxID=1336204 RepID=A0ABP9A9A8_9MICO